MTKLLLKATKTLTFALVEGTKTLADSIDTDVDDAVSGRRRATVYATIRPSFSAEGFTLTMVCEIPDCSTSAFVRTCETAEEAIRLAGNALLAFRSRGRVLDL